MTIIGLISCLTLLIIDLILRVFYFSITQTTLISFGISVFFSLFLWSFIDLVILNFSYSIQVFLRGLIAFLWVVLIGIQVTAFMRFGEYVSPFMANWVISDPKYIFDYIIQLANVKNLVFFFLVWLLFHYIWKFKSKLHITLNRKTLWLKIGLSASLTLVCLNQLRHETVGQLRFPDGALAITLDIIFNQKKLNGYHFSTREVINSSTQTKIKPHIFLFIGESWSKGKIPTYGWTSSDTMPFLNKLSQEDIFQVFKYGYSNSGATDISLPSLFSGVGPEESSDKMHRLPLIRDWAKASGYRTIFISPQRLSFNGIHQFLLSPGPDLFIPGDAIDFRIVNDSGIDDLKAVSFLELKLKEIDINEKPLLIVFFHNALHFPFLTESPGIKVPNFTTRYEKALFITDQVLKKIIYILKEKKMWNKTLFWITADHGEVEVPIHNVPRISSFYQEILNIPFMIHWPNDKKIKNIFKNCEQFSELNKDVNVQNLDIIPTLVELWGFNKNNQQIYSSLRGSSLCSKVSNDRIIIHLNTNKNRVWTPEGFAITKGFNRYSFTNIEGNKFFDLSPNVNNNQEKQILNPSRKTIEPYLKVIKSESLLIDLLNRYNLKN